MTLGRMAAGEACRTEGLEAEDPVVVEVVVSVVAVVSGGGGAACRSCLVCPRELAGGNHTHNRVFYQAGNEGDYDVGGYLLVAAIIAMRGRKTSEEWRL